MNAQWQDICSVVDVLVGPAAVEMAGRLADDALALGTGEREALVREFRESTRDLVAQRVLRVLVLEYHAYARGGAGRRWADFLALAGDAGFWPGLAGIYPALPGRVHQLVSRRSARFAELANRFGADRDLVAGRFAAGGELRGVSAGMGDSHRGGATVTKVSLDGGVVYYKPRSLRADLALAAFLADLHASGPGEPLVRVPDVLDRGPYGWSAAVEHRYCAGEADEALFYRGVGAWAAIMVLLRGADLHLENLIANGPTPVVVDCEALFVPPMPEPAAGTSVTAYAVELVRHSVMRTGLLPRRASAKAPDVSALGGLPEFQPELILSAVADLGSDDPRVTPTGLTLGGYQNRPTPQPRPGRYCDEIVEGYRDYAGRIDRMAAAGTLEPALGRFADCQLRAIARPTQLYVDLLRALWHPASLRDADGAQAEVRRILHREPRAIAPDDAALVGAEVAELVADDVPTFHFTPGGTAIVGFDGQVAVSTPERPSETVARWGAHDRVFDELVIRSSLASAYEAHFHSTWPARSGRREATEPAGALRAVCADLVRGLADAAIRGPDGGAAWISVSFVEDQPALAPLPGLYGGQLGICVALAAYRWAVRQRLAEPVDGLDDLLAGALAVVTGDPAYPDETMVGGYHGWGSRLWAWLTLDRLGVDGAAHRALACLASIEDHVDGDAHRDVIAGAAGAIVPLLNLAARTGEPRAVAAASRAGRTLLDSVAADPAGGDPAGDVLAWLVPDRDEPLGGFAHGSAGIGWALGRLGIATGERHWLAASDAALRFARARWDLDGGFAERVSTWCHGYVGLGLAAADLHRLAGQAHHAELAAECASRIDLDDGANHTLCHGDLGVWELYVETGRKVAADELAATLLDQLTQAGPRVGLAPGASAPGLLDGAAGVVYQLLRMADPRIPSVLLLA